jgi:hypothetical protein
MASVFWESDGSLMEFLERCHSEFRAMCADVKEVKTTNSMVSAK